MQEHGYLQWYNENSGRAYPLSEHASGRTVDGRYLPTDILADLQLMVPEGLGDAYVSSLRITPTLITLGISTPETGLLVGTFARGPGDAHTAHPLTAVLPNVSGWVVFGTMNLHTSATYIFDGPAASGLEKRAVRVVPAPPVHKFIRFGGRPSNYADNIVHFRGGGGMILERSSEDPQRIIVRLNPEAKSNFVGPCNDTESRDTCNAPPMRKISGVCPDEDGKIIIRFE